MPCCREASPHDKGGVTDAYYVGVKTKLVRISVSAVARLTSGSRLKSRTGRWTNRQCMALCYYVNVQNRAHRGCHMELMDDRLLTRPRVVKATLIMERQHA